MSGDLGNSYNIDIWGLLIALGMVAVAAIISELMHMGIGKTLMWSSCRALVQLCAMGFIIGYVIRSNSVWMVFALMAVMLVAAVQIVMSRARGIPKGLAGPIFLSLVITMLLMLALVTELIVRPHPWYAPQLVVPLTGMLLGNTVTALAVGLSRFYESMEERRDEVDMMLALGATPWESARPSIVSSIRLGLLPTTASLASSGIVTIPGMMAGQVIAGGDPLNAAKYQFVVLDAIAALTLLADGLIMVMIYRTCFTADDQYRPACARHQQLLCFGSLRRRNHLFIHRLARIHFVVAPAFPERNRGVFVYCFLVCFLEYRRIQQIFHGE